TVSGGRAASVSIADDAPGTPHTIPLSGNGTTPAPAVMLTPTSVTFASQLVGSTSASQSSMVKNTGTDVLTITSIGTTGSNAADFGQTNDCPGTLAVNATCTITVTFSPTATGVRAANAQITDDAGGSPQSIALSGTGTAPALTLSPATVNFGSQRVGTTSAAQTVNV